MQWEDESGAFMMLPSDMALWEDAQLRAIVLEYAHDEATWFHDFALAFHSLQERSHPPSSLHLLHLPPRS